MSSSNTTGVKRRKSQKSQPPSAAKPVASSSSSPVKQRKYEFRRKLLHSTWGFLALYGFANDYDAAIVVNTLTVPLAIIVTADILRFRWPAFARLYERLLGFLMRPSERTTWNGVIWYLLGIILVLTLLPRDIAVLSVCVLSWVDTAASTIGRIFGRYTPSLPFPALFARRKSLAGTGAAITVGAIATAIFFGRVAPSSSMGAPSWLPERRFTFKHPAPSPLRLPTPASTLSLPALSIGCGLIAGLAEAIEINGPFGGVDDNLSLPVLAGLGIWLYLYLTSKDRIFG